MSMTLLSQTALSDKDCEKFAKMIGDYLFIAQSR
jgi:hypothetical protein